MFYKVPTNNGILDIDYSFLIEGVQISTTECYVKLKNNALVRDSWQEVTEEEFNQIKESLLAPSE